MPAHAHPHNQQRKHHFIKYKKKSHLELASVFPLRSFVSLRFAYQFSESALSQNLIKIHVKKKPFRRREKKSSRQTALPGGTPERISCNFRFFVFICVFSLSFCVSFFEGPCSPTSPHCCSVLCMARYDIGMRKFLSDPPQGGLQPSWELLCFAGWLDPTPRGAGWGPP